MVKEAQDVIGRYRPSSDSLRTYEPIGSPLEGHLMSKEYRTKMTDWMVEVCSSFKCSPRTYFLSVALFDRYLAAAGRKGAKLTNKDVHPIGVTSIYMASKFEDVFPLHSKVVSEKIAHGAMTSEDIVAKEREFLELFGYQLDVVTEFDFFETYMEKIA